MTVQHQARGSLISPLPVPGSTTVPRVVSSARAPSLKPRLEARGDGVQRFAVQPARYHCRTLVDGRRTCPRADRELPRRGRMAGFRYTNRRDVRHHARLRVRRLILCQLATSCAGAP
jgi:hypothetical protein